MDLFLGPVKIEPSNPADPEDCMFLFPEGMEGLEGGVEDRGEQDDLLNGSGAFSVSSFLSSRVITLRGGMVAPSPEQLVQKQRVLTSVLRGDRTTPLVVQDELTRTWRSVRRQRQPKFRRHGNDLRYAEFDLLLWCPDPFYYGETRTYAPGQLAVNHGNSDARPVVYVRGPQPSGYTVGDASGGEIVVTQALGAGVTDVIDLTQGWVKRSGVLISGAVSKFKPWVVPAYGSTVHTFSGAMADMWVEVTDTNE